MGKWWLCLLIACGSSHHAPDAAPGVDAPGHVSVRIIAFNDFHGALDADASGPGAAALAHAIAAERNDHTVVVSAGDLIGGSPLTSGLFHDEPTIDVMNAIGLDYNGVGNHEFDEGTAELLRMQQGGCHPTDGCAGGEAFTGSTAKFLAANVTYVASGQTIFPAYAIRDVGGAKVAFVGVTTRNTPASTLASGITDLAFADEVATVNALVPELRAAGAQAIVVLLHEGGSLPVPELNGCTGLTGRVVDIANGLDPAVTWIASAHTHRAYNCSVAGHVVTSAGSHGLAITVADLDIDLASGTVASITANNEQVFAANGTDPTIAALVAHWDQLAAPVGDRVVGTITADITSSSGGEIAMGDVIADAMLDGTSSLGTQAALMNPGGVRAGLAFAKTPPETVDGQVRYAEAFAVQPFGNNVLAVTLSGADLAAALDTSVGLGGPMLVSGLTYTYHVAATPGSHVTVNDVAIGGSPLVAMQSYRLVINSIVAQPETYPSLANATDPVGVGVDLDILTSYLAAHSPLAPPPPGRITAQ